MLCAGIDNYNLSILQLNCKYIEYALLKQSIIDALTVGAQKKVDDIEKLKTMSSSSLLFITYVLIMLGISG